MPGHRLEPLQALRRSEEEQAMSRLAEAVAARTRAEAAAEVLEHQVDAARDRLARALRELGSWAEPEHRSRAIIAAQIHMRDAFIERLRIDARRAEQRRAMFHSHELPRARAAEEEAQMAYRQHRGEREGLDKHLAALGESERRRAERLADET
jgi:hypothetical protein